MGDGEGGWARCRRSVSSKESEILADYCGRSGRSRRLEPHARNPRSTNAPRRRRLADREVSTHSIALLTMRAPNARMGAAAHMYMMFFAVVGSIFVRRRPMDARGRVRSRCARKTPLGEKAGYESHAMHCE